MSTMIRTHIYAFILLKFVRLYSFKNIFQQRVHYKDSYRSSALLCVQYVKEVLPFFIIIIKYTLKIGQEVLDIQCDNWYFLSGNFTYIHVSLMCGAIWKNRIKDYSCTFLYCTPYILISYWVTQKLPQICTIFYVSILGRLRNLYICVNFWVTQYTLNL